MLQRCLGEGLTPGNGVSHHLGHAQGENEQPPSHQTFVSNPNSQRHEVLPEAKTSDLVRRLVIESRRFDASGCDPQRSCWMAVHEHVHGVLPSEYDIRDVPEDLVLAVLAERRRQD